MERRLPAAILATLACLALCATGCAATHGAGRGAASTGGSGTPGTGTPGTAAADARYATAAESPARQAEAAATAILRAFVPPPGAARQAAEPASARHSLDSVGGSESAYQVRATTWWLAPGQAGALIAWESAHLPRSFAPTSSDSSSGPGTIPVTGQFYELPRQRALIGQDLHVAVADLGGGKTAIRVDAEVDYQPVRPAGERVPATARAVTIAEVSGSPGAKAPAPATIVKTSVVGRLAALVNGLPVSTFPPDAPCPMRPGLILRLTFRATAGGRPLAVAQGPIGCGTLALTVAGKEWPQLGLPGPFSTQVLRIAGLRWPATVQGGAPRAP